MSQAKLAAMLLLLTPFVQKNQQIYKDDPRMLAKFDNLGLEDLELGVITKSGGIHSASIKSTSRAFQGPAQKWRPVDVHSDKVITLTSDEVLEDKTAALGQVEGGVFSYLGEDGETKLIVVVPDVEGADVGEEAVSALIAALKYDVAGSDIALGDGTSTIVVSSDFIAGEIEYGVAKAPVDELEEDAEPLDL